MSGRRPFAGDSVAEVLAKIAREEPPALRPASGGVPRDLRTVVSKCLAKEPEHRYPAAGELADDLARFARGEPVTARRPGAVERVARWARRKPTLAGLIAACVTVVGLAGVVAAVASLWQEAAAAHLQAQNGLSAEAAARHDAERAQTALQTANGQLHVARRELEWANYTHLLQLAFTENRAGHGDVARSYIDAANPALRGWEWHFVRNLCYEGAVAAYASNHARWYGPGMVVYNHPKDGTQVLVSFPGGKTLGTIAKDSLHDSTSPDATRIVIRTDDRAPVVRTLATGAEVTLDADGVTRLDFVRWSADGRRVLGTGGAASASGTPSRGVASTHCPYRNTRTTTTPARSAPMVRESLPQT